MRPEGGWLGTGFFGVTVPLPPVGTRKSQGNRRGVLSVSCGPSGSSRGASGGEGAEPRGEVSGASECLPGRKGKGTALTKPEGLPVHSQEPPCCWGPLSGGPRSLPPPHCTGRSPRKGKVAPCERAQPPRHCRGGSCSRGALEKARKALTWKGLRRGQLGIAAWCVDAADLNEAGHQHDQGDAHQQNGPPVCLEWQRIEKGWYPRPPPGQTLFLPPLPGSPLLAAPQ